MVLTITKEEWKYTLTTLGEPSVTVVGILIMLMLCVECLDTVMHSQLDHPLTMEKEVVLFGWTVLGVLVERAVLVNVTTLDGEYIQVLVTTEEMLVCFV